MEHFSARPKVRPCSIASTMVGTHGGARRAGQGHVRAVAGLQPSMQPGLQPSMQPRMQPGLHPGLHLCM